MKIFVTGAAGFIGSCVVEEAIRRGHFVRALVRPSHEISHLHWRNHPQVELVRADLRCKKDIKMAVDGVNAVINLALSRQDDFYTNLIETIIGSENLLEAMVTAKVSRIIHVSSFSVYGYLDKRTYSLLDEFSPLENKPDERDVYSRIKLIQEDLIRDYASEHNLALTVIRPGIVYGINNLWNGCLSFKINDRLWIEIGGRAIYPITYVENCAGAIILSLENQQSIGRTFNVVDDHLPTKREYTKKIKGLFPGVKTFSIPWVLMKTIASFIWIINISIFKRRLKLPGILIPSQLNARFKPLNYSNKLIKEAIGWEPYYSLDKAMAKISQKNNPEGSFSYKRD